MLIELAKLAPVIAALVWIVFYFKGEIDKKNDEIKKLNEELKEIAKENVGLLYRALEAINKLKTEGNE